MFLQDDFLVKTISFLYDHFQIKAGNSHYFVIISTIKRKLLRHLC